MDCTIIFLFIKKNTNIDKVQFVIKTGGIQIEEIEEDNAKEAKTLNIWQKFLNLFGLYDEDWSVKRSLITKYFMEAIEFRRAEI